MCSYFNNFFDFTDGSYYWLYTKYAESFFGVTQFGHYTGIIYTLVFKNIFLHRVVGAVLLLGAFFYLTYYVEKKTEQIIKSERLVNKSTAWLMTSFLLFFYGNYFLVGLSYNWLSFLGTIMFLGGIFSLLDKDKKASFLIYKYLYLSLGGWLAWNAKPTTAVGLVFILCVFLLIHYKKEEIKKLQLLKWSSVFMLIFLCLHIVFFEKGINAYIKEYADGLEAVDILGVHKVTITKKILELWGEYTSLLVDVISKKVTLIVIAIAIGLKVTFWIMCYSNTSTRQSEKFLAWSSTFLLIIAFIPLDMGFGIRQLSLTLLYFYTAFFCVGVINLDMEIVVYGKQDKSLGFIYQKLYLLSLSVLLLLAPFAVVIGTGNTYSAHMYGFLGFILLAIYILIRSNSFFKKISGIFVVFWLIIAVVTVIKAGMTSPYRMPESVFAETYETKFLTDNNHLNLNGKANKYIVELQKNALENDWVVGDSLIDLTGATPGAALALGAHVYGAPWLLGGYKGSNDFAIFVLKKTAKKDLRSAWVLSSPDARRKLDVAILNKLGLDFPARYKKVGTVIFDYHRKETHDLWKPSRENPRNQVATEL